MTVEEKKMLFCQCTDTVTAAEKLQKYSTDASLQFPDLWKDVMKLDLKKIDADPLRTSWKKTTLSFYQVPAELTSEAFALNTDPEWSYNITKY